MYITYHTNHFKYEKNSNGIFLYLYCYYINKNKCLSSNKILKKCENKSHSKLHHYAFILLFNGLTINSISENLFFPEN